ncbi:hypothetical protein BJ165DRAFT_1410196 [Panaeolus papilionaceus]|nr:hypothetical protein BJ165DRAFT_1410196 [Panaeolus papilionaceus]
MYYTGLQIIGSNMSITERNADKAQYLVLMDDDETRSYFDQVDITHMTTTKNGVKLDYDILLGPTGAGKSSFIQALAGDSQDLGISKDQLAGFTQTASAYRIVNVFFQDGGKHHPIFLLDTPGFSDPKISHLGVLAASEATHVKLLFLTPITDTRMPGTRRRTIEMLTATFEPSKYSLALSIEFSDMGATTVRFTNTRESALKILDTGPWKNDSYQNSVAGEAFIYRDLHERIESALQQKEVITSELFHPQAQTNLELRDILKKNHRENEERLKKFVKEFLAGGSPPAGYEDAHYHLIKSLPGRYVPLTTSVRIFVLRYHLIRLVRNAKRCASKWIKPNT